MKHLPILFCLFCLTSFSQEYAVNLIPDSLKENANAVLRKEELFVEIKDIDKAVVHHKYAITILNETGNHYATYGNMYDKLVSLSDIDGVLYDAAGVKIKSAKRKDIHDYSDDGDNFSTDNRVKTFSFSSSTYPYTVEFEDEQVYNGIFYLPKWTPFLDEKIAVQQSKFIVETPIDYQLRYRKFNYTKQPIITTGKRMNYSWEMYASKAIVEEPFSPSWSEITPAVWIAPTNFSISGYSGNMNNWKEYGKFQSVLSKDRDNIPDAIKTAIHQLTDPLKTDEEKVKAVYEYLQKNTRYISIQLGIGGWQPLAANFVAEKKYGDCKALSNFMISLLKELNIKANPVLIKSGRGVTKGLIDDFPSNCFNHMISCVPMENDTIWLECTSQTTSAGYMGLFTGNRTALMITDDGGVVVHTPKFVANENKVVRNINAAIDETGTLKLNAISKLTGTEQEDEHSLLNDFNEEQRIKYLNKVYDLPTYSIDKIEYKETKAKVPVIDETLAITAPSYANITGKRMFVVPNLLTKEMKLDNTKPRVFDIVYRRAYKNIDSIEITIPNGYTLEMMPKNINTTNKFGVYKIEYSFSNNTIKVVRYYEQNVNPFPASDYPSLVDFYEQMAKADRAKIVFVKG